MSKVSKLFWDRWNRSIDPRHPERPTMSEWLMDSAILVLPIVLLVILLKACVDLILEFLP